MKSHTIPSSDGVELHIDEAGTPNGRPLLFIHGYTQSRLAWNKQMESALGDEFRLIAMDNRGHGLSEKPHDAYEASERWADDVQAVIDTLELADPILVGWSYGGLIIADYLEKYGEEHIAGVNLVGAISKFGTEDANALIGESVLELVPGFFSTDAEESMAALETFVRYCTYEEPSPQEFYYVLGFNAIVPPHVRESLLSRAVTHDDLLPTLEKPVLVTHGREDVVVLPTAAEEHASAIPNARTSFYSEVGHTPFREDPERFNRELREFVMETDAATVDEPPSVDMI